MLLYILTCKLIRWQMEVRSKSNPVKAGIQRNKMKYKYKFITENKEKDVKYESFPYLFWSTYIEIDDNVDCFILVIWIHRDRR